MVPSSYSPYFTTVATAAAALIGLLFVAVSLRDETIFGGDARPGGEALAITAFTGLVNSFTVALLALIPDANVGIAAVVLALISLVSVVRLNSRLHVARNGIVLAITLAAYGAQLGYGIVLILNSHDTGEIPSLAYILFATLVVALQRAWSLLRGRHLLPGTTLGGPAARAASRIASAQPEQPKEAPGDPGPA
jgi:hypothetical protein